MDRKTLIVIISIVIAVIVAFLVYYFVVLKKPIAQVSGSETFILTPDNPSQSASITIPSGTSLTFTIKLTNAKPNSVYSVKMGGVTYYINTNDNGCGESTLYTSPLTSSTTIQICIPIPCLSTSYILTLNVSVSTTTSSTSTSTTSSSTSTTSTTTTTTTSTSTTTTTTSSVQTFNIYNKCSTTVIAYVTYPGFFPNQSRSYILNPGQTVIVVYKPGVYVMFESLSRQILGTVYPSPGQTITPPRCPSPTRSPGPIPLFRKG